MDTLPPQTTLRPIALEPGADAISHDALVKQWFTGWTATWPEGDITWRLLFPDRFPRSDIWSGQISVGAKELRIHGRTWELEAAIYTPDQQEAREALMAEQQEKAAAEAAAQAPSQGAPAETPSETLPAAPAASGRPEAAAAAGGEQEPSPKQDPAAEPARQTPWTLHRLGARNQDWLRAVPDPDREPPTADEQAAAEAAIRDRLLATAQEVHAIGDHDDALLWSQAYAWALMITRKQFNQLWAGDLKGEAFDVGEARNTIRRQCQEDPWNRDDLRRMTQHPRQEVRSLAVNIIQERARAADPAHQARLAKAREAGADIAASARQMEGLGAALRNATATKDPAATDTETTPAPAPADATVVADPVTPAAQPPAQPSPVRRSV